MHCCIPTPTTDSNSSMGMIWVTLNMLMAAEECRELSGYCQGISHCLESGHPVLSSLLGWCHTRCSMENLVRKMLALSTYGCKCEVKFDALRYVTFYRRVERCRTSCWTCTHLRTCLHQSSSTSSRPSTRQHGSRRDSTGCLADTTSRWRPPRASFLHLPSPHRQRQVLNWPARQMYRRSQSVKRRLLVIKIRKRDTWLAISVYSASWTQSRWDTLLLFYYHYINCRCCRYVHSAVWSVSHFAYKVGLCWLTCIVLHTVTLQWQVVECCQFWTVEWSAI